MGRMKKHLIDVHNMYVGGFMHLMQAFVAHPCMRNDGCVFCVTCSEEPAKQTDSKGVASAQGRGILSGFVTKHFAPGLSDEEHKHAYALMVKAHSAAILPPSINDISEYRQYLQYTSHRGYSLPHRTETTELPWRMRQWQNSRQRYIYNALHSCMHA